MRENKFGICTELFIIIARLIIFESISGFVDKADKLDTACRMPLAECQKSDL